MLFEVEKQSRKQLRSNPPFGRRCPSRAKFLHRSNQKPGGCTQQYYEAAKVEAVGPAETLCQIGCERGGEQAAEVAHAVEETARRACLAATRIDS